ncbi:MULTISPECIES: hypothetical protein [Brevibacillus]|jgi:hypothetical protein|uniref:hypothetical protein n=1 Tax=Brevibacillus TaxID=55080 RepID=UPI0005D10243|nr:MULTISPECIES: hypothetical protein [Bacillales]UFJ62318.1 hypothetical protein IRT44_05795 [Anoxybacillus sediminis]UYZ13576.1 hypothetical protein A6764_00860 [Brevibacillus sp. WF146]
MAKYFDYMKKFGRPLNNHSLGPEMIIIKTKLDNIRTETILRPLSKTDYTGINGGFFAADSYDEPPTEGRSIAYNEFDEGDKVTYKGRTLPEIYEYNGTAKNQKSRKTAVLYEKKGTIKADYMYARNLDDVKARYDNITNVIGGTSFAESDWSPLAYQLPTYRTIFAWDDTNAYLIAFTDPVTVPHAKQSIEFIGLDPKNAIVLDGSGSTSIQVYDDGNRKKNYCFYGEDRYLFNIVRVKKDY